MGGIFGSLGGGVRIKSRDFGRFSDINGNFFHSLKSTGGGHKICLSH